MNADSALPRQARWLESYRPRLRIEEQGSVVSVGDGITWISGLPTAMMDEVLQFDDGTRALVFDLTQDLIGAILLRDTDRLTAGTPVHRTGRTLDIPAGDTLIGRIVDPLGEPLDDLPPPQRTQPQPLEAPSPGLVCRDFVNEPLYTGIKIIDTLVPIGKGQRQLLIGDEGLGRSSIAIDSVINQKDKDLLCVYVLIGQKRSTTVNILQTLRDAGALAYTTLVVAEASDLPGLQHLAPFAGCAIGEFWMRQGRDVLIVYDDLSTHARTYRELSLLLRRPPGREAFPGDIFSIHARLLERATCLNAAHGGGSMTALPIVETKLGEIATYIPTNLISITDGQVYLERDLFTAGLRPAIDIGRSVSRIGGQAQHPRVKEEAGRMKLDYLQYLELEVFTRFGAKLEASMEAAIHRGHLLREILKQDRLCPLSENFQLAWLIAFNDHRFEAAQPEEIPRLLARLERAVAESELTLMSSRDSWSQAIAQWLGTSEVADDTKT
ncbi:MAG: F0F1 ATP synthase subunit alpha [Candidatus Thiodiazotropha sp.]